MGGIVEGGVVIGTKTSPRQAAIDKAQAELRLEYDIREERRRELEFLEKGGNPLDFKFGIKAPLSVQSSSHADQLNDQCRNCDTRGGSPAASPLGDSIGSSGRLGANVTCEPNGADNFDGENEIVESEGKRRYTSRSNNTPSEHSSQRGGNQNVRESEDSPNFHPKKAYRRRNRSKTSRDNARSSAIDISSRSGHSSLSDRRRVLSKSVGQESPSDMDGSTAADPANGGLSEDKDISNSKHMHDDSHNQDMGYRVSTAMTSVEPDPCRGVELKNSSASEFLDSSAEKYVNVVDPEQQNKPDRLDGDGNCAHYEGVVSSQAVTLKGLDSETALAQTSDRIDGNGNTDSKICSMKNVDSTGEQMEHQSPLESTENENAEKNLKDSIAESNSCINDSRLSQSYQANGYSDKDQKEIEKNLLSSQYEGKGIPCDEDRPPNEHKDPLVGLQHGSDSIQKVETHCTKNEQDLHSQSIHELTKIDGSCSVSVPELQPCGNQTKVVDKAHEDLILDNARSIMAKHKIIEDLSIGSLPKEYHSKSHWDFVLEEMAWMANDFAQERVWKRTAATQLCYRAAFASRLRFGERDKHERDKVLARTLAKSVMDFWHSAAKLVGVNGNVSGSETCKHGTATSDNTDGNAKVENDDHNKDVKMSTHCALQGYAVRFLGLNSPVMQIVNDAASNTPEGEFIVGSHEMTFQNQHVEEDLFYVVPHGAMETYRKSVGIHLAQCLRASKNSQEVNTSMYNAVGEFQNQDNGYEEDEGENAYYLPRAFEGTKGSKFAQKKRKNSKLLTPRSYEMGGDFSYGHCTENRIRFQQSSLKRPANGLNACPIPTKRVRTASRQRVVGPFSSGAAGFMSLPIRTDASSGDTNSYQDDQSSLNGSSLAAKGLEVESGMDYDKQSTFDSAELTPKRKKKKTKHQRDHFKRRLESHQLDSNSINDPIVPHAKKLKMMKQSLENSFDNTNFMSGSVASPGRSQMSNMSNPNKLIKLIGGRDRGRKTKSHKMSSVQTGPGCSWSTFEDQALVVLVHDMGPNWELVSDAINSTLHFKCIFRKPQECKERHAILVEKSWGDGADTEDSGSSQPYPSTLPGIPKGGARQLFQQLRGPMEEDTIKSHFEKIILIGQHMHGRKKQEPRQLVSVHISHLAALSQAIPNVNGCVLTPLDLCDMASSSPDVFSGSYQSPHNGSLPLPNQASSQPMLPSLSTSSSLQGPPGSNMASPSARDGRHGISRANLPIDEQQRIQQYNQLLSSRSVQQPNMSAPGTFSGNDLGGRILPGGNGVSIPRPGNMVGTPSSMNMQLGAGVSQGISMLRPRDASMMRVSHGNNRGVSNYSGLSSSFPSQSASSGPTFPAQHQQHLMHQQHSNALSNSHHPHLQGSSHSGSTTEQQTLARDRQLHQRMLQRQQQKQQHQQSQATASQPVSLPPLSPSSSPVPSQQQQKHQIPRRIPMGGMMNQGGKPRQLQQQSGRHHPPQRQPPPQSQQQAKILKGMGRGNSLVHQHNPVNSPHLNNGLTSTPGSQLEKGEKPMYQSQPSKPASLPPQQKLHSNSAPVSLSQVPAVLTSIQSNPPPILPPPNQQSKAHQHPPVQLVNQRQPNIHRAVSQNHATNSDPVTERQNDPSQVEQQLANNAAELANTVPASEIPSGSLIPNPQLGSTTENEPITPGAHALVPKKPPNSLAPSLEIQRKQVQQLQTNFPNQVVPQEKHHPHQQQVIEQSSQRQPLLHQHPQPPVQTSQSNTLTNNSTLD